MKREEKKKSTAKQKRKHRVIDCCNRLFCALATTRHCFLFRIYLFIWCAVVVLMARILLLFVYEFKIKAMNHYFMTDARLCTSLNGLNEYSNNVPALWRDETLEKTRGKQVTANRQHVTIREYVCCLCCHSMSTVSSKYCANVFI